MAERRYLPDTMALAERLRSCLQDSEEPPKDFTKLFDDGLFKFDTDLVPETLALFEQLSVKHEPLSLIQPQFETPLPPLQPAVFLPTFREPPPPALELFDLDEQFASERIRLAQLTNKCTSDDDLDFYVREAGEILGITTALPLERRGPKDILEYVLTVVANFKRLNQDAPPLVTSSSSSSGASASASATGAKLSAGGAGSGAGGGGGAAGGGGAGAGGAAGSPGKFSQFSHLYQSHIGVAVAGPAGIGPAVAAGFHSPTKAR